MKRAVVLILIAGLPGAVFAQAGSLLGGGNYIYADVQCPLFSYGGSVTWVKHIINHLDVGAGVQLTDYNAGNNYVHNAVYASIRPYINIKRRNKIFFVADAGYDFYHGLRDQWNDNSNNGFYMGLGPGYGRVINKRGLMLYATFKLQGDAYLGHQYEYLPGGTMREVTNESMDLSLVVSAGVRF
jgi:hypothetical protein